MPQSQPLLAGVELGGTKCVCILGFGPEDIRDEVRLPTTTPSETLTAVEQVLRRWRYDGHRIGALGIASFGPIDVDQSSATYGFITSTTKPGWIDSDVAGRLARHVGVPTGFDTDVNGAALAEGRWGGTAGLADHAYVTVGTGVGVGLIVRGRPIGGFTHAELGHIRPARASGDAWPGSCPYHGACVEGLASGTAIAARTGARGETLDRDDPVWPLVAHAIAQLLHTLVLAAAPRRILLGGGVMQAQPQLFPMVRSQLHDSIAGYVRAQELDERLDWFVAPPALGDKAGPLGALALAADALES